MSPNCSVLFCEMKLDLAHIFLSDLKYRLPVVYHSSEAVRHDRENFYSTLDS